MHLDPDLQWFLVAVVLMVVLGLPAITGKISLPGQLKFLEVPLDKLTAPQAEYFRQFDEKLNEIGYHPYNTFRVVNLSGVNLNRVYASSSDPARILVTLLTSTGGTSAQNYTEIITRFQDGTILSTKNSSVSSVFAAMPKKVSQVFPSLQDLLELKRRHDAKAQGLILRNPLYRNVSTFFDDFQGYHRRFCEYQQGKRLLRLDPRTGVYRATVWLGLRGIQNFLNPLADNFTLPRFALGLLAGALPPLVILVKPAFLLGIIQSRLGIDLALATLLLLGIAYALAGSVVGYIFTRKSFIWAFLLGYLPIHFLALPAGNRISWAFWMACVAHAVSNFRLARKRLA